MTIRSDRWTSVIILTGVILTSVISAPHLAAQSQPRESVLRAPDFADTDGVPYELHLELYQYDDRLIGAATTYALPGRSGPRLSFWVELNRHGKK